MLITDTKLFLKHTKKKLTTNIVGLREKLPEKITNKHKKEKTKGYLLHEE